VDPAAVAKLTEMGFSQDKAEATLHEHKGNLDAAIDALLNGTALPPSFTDTSLNITFSLLVILSSHDCDYSSRMFYVLCGI
jgi:hypothetical protein